MLKFKQYITEQKNTHMEHAEDDVLNHGVSGARSSINALRAVRDMLAGKSTKRVDITVKWDGAPAVFVGIDPSDGKFFVAKKGIFNKNPKIYKTPSEIDADTSGDLAEKLKASLEEFKNLGIKKGVIQGDLLFTKKDLKTATIDGEEYITFHPNTIVYAIPTESELAKEIKAANIGVVWHTVYEGDTFESMKAVFGKDILSMINKTSKVWSTDVNYRDLSGKATLTSAETDKITKILSDAGKVFYRIDAKALNMISTNDDLRDRIKTFNNTKVRNQLKITNVKRHVQELIQFIHDYYEKEASKKGEKGKASTYAKRDEILKYFTPAHQAELESIFTLMNLLAEAKLMLITKLDQVKSIGTFLMTNKGYEVTGVEGYVAIDHLGGNTVKLVDRMRFSYANFSPDVIKGWQR